jgi:predicted MFS family arabinose efflux permease
VNIPREPAVARILVAVCVWNFAVGLFAPFYAVFFSNWLHEPVSAIGLDLAGGQVVGALFVAFAPAVVAARGPVTGARFMMFFAGACALFLAVAASPLTAGVGYAAYMGFVAMAQVPLQTLLMNRVRTDEQSGASMLAALVGFCAVAAGGFVGGELISALGFGPLLVLAGAASMLAALVFVVLVRADPHEGEGGVAVPAGGA